MILTQKAHNIIDRATKVLPLITATYFISRFIVGLILKG